MPRKCYIAQRTVRLLPGPLLYARRVEVVPLVARQRCHFVTLTEIAKADDALNMLVEALV